jgi:hypothetical protein
VSECLSWFEIDDKAGLARRVHGKTDLNPAFALRLKHRNLSVRQLLPRSGMSRSYEAPIAEMPELLSTDEGRPNYTGQDLGARGKRVRMQIV